MTGVGQGYLLFLYLLSVTVPNTLCRDYEDQEVCAIFETCAALPKYICIWLYNYYQCQQQIIPNVTESCGEGTVTSRVSGRVVGGQDAVDGQYPWTAYLFGCGGVIINDRTILTAAHCVRSGVDQPGSVRVGYGSVNKSKVIEVQVQRVAVHPEHIQVGLDNDIAVLTLSQPLPNDGAWRSVCLPGTSRRPLAGELCAIAGWGQTRSNGIILPLIMKTARLPIVRQDICEAIYASNARITVSERQICAGYLEQGGVDGCLGDSGGPLICLTNNRWTLYGIASTGEGCAERGLPGVYASVSYHLNWINSVINN